MGGCVAGQCHNPFESEETGPKGTMISAPAIMQQAPAATDNADIKGILSRALEMSTDTTTTGADAPSTVKATTDAKVVETSTTLVPGSSTSLSNVSSLTDTKAAAGVVAPTDINSSSIATVNAVTARRSGRSRKPSSKAVENKANAAALAAAGLLGHGDEYVPAAARVAIISRESSTLSLVAPSSPSVTSSAVDTGASATAVVSPKGGKKSWKKPVGKPKRPLSAYNIFFKEERARLVADINGAATGGASATTEEAKRQQSEAARSHRKTHGMGFAGLAQNIAGKWKTLDNASRRPYEKKAAVDKARYVREVAAWKTSLQKTGEQGHAGYSTAPSTPRAHQVTDSSSEDEAPRRRSKKRKSPSKKVSTPKRKQPKSTKKRRSRATSSTTTTCSEAANRHQLFHMHHEQQQMESSEQYYLPNQHSTGTATTVKGIAMFEPTAVESSSAAAAPASAQGYLPSAHAPQQWDGLDQMMLGVGGASDLNDILSLEF